MSRCYKVIKDGILCAIGKDESTGETISEKEYSDINSIVKNKPEDTETEIYVLDAENLEYKAVKIVV